MNSRTNFSFKIFQIYKHVDRKARDYLAGTWSGYQHADKRNSAGFYIESLAGKLGHRPEWSRMNLSVSCCWAISVLLTHNVTPLSSLSVCEVILFLIIRIYVNLIGDDIRAIERNAEVLLNACKDIGLAVNIGKTKYMEIGRHRGMIANEHIRIGSNSYFHALIFPVLSAKPISLQAFNNTSAFLSIALISSPIKFTSSA